jgi:hypothetical protein
VTSNIEHDGKAMLSHLDANFGKLIKVRIQRNVENDLRYGITNRLSIDGVIKLINFEFDIQNVVSDHDFLVEQDLRKSMGY